jgi:putative ABC transport system permease protein
MSASLSLFRHFILRDLLKNWVRTFLSLVGIALGVAVVLAISLATHTALTQFKETADLISGKANLEICPSSEPLLDQSCLEQIRWLWTIGGKFTPIINENVTLNDKDKTMVQLLGIDMLADPDFKNYANEKSSKNQTAKANTKTALSEISTISPEKSTSVAQLPEKQSSISKQNTDINALDKDACLIGARLAHDKQLKIGDTFEVIVNEKSYLLTVAQILSPEGIGSVSTGNTVVVDLITAQNLLNIPGKVSQVEIIIPEPEKTWQPVKQQLENELPPGVRVQQPQRRATQIDKMTRSFQYNLLALTFIALLVGMFLIYNTMTISVIRRRSEIGTLRALGLSRLTIITLFAFEALWFGIVGSSAGLILGIAFAQGALTAVAATFQHFYVNQPLEHINCAPEPLLLAFFLGVLATLLASLAPAIEAARIAPAEASKRASNETKTIHTSKTLALGAILSFVLGAIATMAPPIFGFPVFGYLAAFLWISSCSLIMPDLLQQFLPAVAVLSHRLGLPEARLAARSLQGALGRTSVVSASLMIGIAMMVSLAIMIGSFRQTVLTWVEQTLKADLWVQTVARASGSNFARMQADTLTKIRLIDGVVAVDGFVEYPIEYKGEPTNLAAADLDVVTKYGNLKFTSGETGAEIYKNMGINDCIISETFAIRKNVKRGQLITLETPNGILPSKVQGVYYDYASDLGYIVISRKAFFKYFKDESISNCAVYISPDKDAYTIRNAIFSKLGNDKYLSIQTTRDLRQQAIKVFDRTFSVTYALHTIAIIVAMLSITNALFALTLESRRDFGILRYLGASAGQLRNVVLVQAGLLGLIGNAAGIVLGFLLSMILIYVINRQSFGWTIQLSLPLSFLFQSSVLVMTTAVLAGLWPANLAAMTQAPKVIREE